MVIPNLKFSEMGGGGILVFNRKGGNQTCLLDFTSEIACSVFVVWNILSVMFKRLTVSQMRKDKRVNQPSANDE